MINPRFVIKAVISGQRLNISIPLTVCGTVNYIGVEAKCTSEWDDCAVVCYIMNSVGNVVQLVMTYDAEKNIYYFPTSQRLTLMAGEWNIWFVGVQSSEGQETYRVTTEVRQFTIADNFFTGSVPQGDITLDEQAIAIANDAKHTADNLYQMYLNGDFKGDKGDTGDPARIGFVQASVDSSTTNPRCDVITTEDPEGMYNIQFDFKGIKGNKGDQGDPGEKGDPGPVIDDYVLVQDTQPVSNTNKVWLKPTASSAPVMLPTVEELEDIEITTNREDFSDIIEYDNYLSGFYNNSSTFIAYGDNGLYFLSFLISASANDVVYISHPSNNFAIAFLDANKNYISSTRINNNEITVPDNVNIEYIAIPINPKNLYSVVASRLVRPPKEYLNYSYYYGEEISTNKYCYGVSSEFSNRIIDSIKIYGTNNEAFVVSQRNNNSITYSGANVSSNSPLWVEAAIPNMKQITILQFKGFIVLATNDSSCIGFSIRNRNINKFNLGTSNYTQLGILSAYDNFFSSHLYVPVTICYKGNWVFSFAHVGMNDEIEIDFSSYIPYSMHFEFGVMSFYSHNSYKNYPLFKLFDRVLPYYNCYDRTQWFNKVWYAYGTSLTQESSGHYANAVAAMSGMRLTNRGIGGGALVANRNIYDRLLDTTDGKNNADLITIEVGANDGSSPLGSPHSLDTNTICGALNYCLKQMFLNGVQAQIVLMASYPGRYSSSDPTDIFDVTHQMGGGWYWEELVSAIRQIADANGFYFVPFNALGMGRTRGNGLHGNDYVTDQIHPTALGGRNVAEGVWYYLRNIPTWHTSLTD